MRHLARALVAPIRLYQLVVSPVLGPRCGFYPSCSEYTVQALLRHGPVHGLYLGVRRLLRCHPWNLGGVDEVPERFRWRHPHAERVPEVHGGTERGAA